MLKASPNFTSTPALVTSAAPVVPLTAKSLPEGMVYDDFDPLLLQQKGDKPLIEFETFDAALDEFYSKVQLRTTTSASVFKMK